jgi:hypothetical protein
MVSYSTFVLVEREKNLSGIWTCFSSSFFHLITCFENIFFSSLVCTETHSNCFRKKVDINQIRWQLNHVWLIEDSTIDISSAFDIFFHLTSKRPGEFFRSFLLERMMSVFLYFYFLRLSYSTSDNFYPVDSQIFYTYGLSNIRWSGNIDTWVFRLLIHTY